MAEMFAYISTVVFAMLFVVWSGKNWSNISLKMMFFGLAASGAFVSLQHLGYLVKL